MLLLVSDGIRQEGPLPQLVSVRKGFDPHRS
jgi:hypothetical protein